MNNILRNALLLLFIFAFTLSANGILQTHKNEKAYEGAFVPSSAPLAMAYSDNEAGYKLPIFMYHSTFSKGPGKYNVPPKQMENDFIWLKENGYTPVTVADLTAFQENGRPLPDKPVMLTFDDGYTNNYIHLFPLIKKYGMKSVVAVVGSLTDRNYKEADNSTEAHMNYEQIKELSESGLVEIQNHTYDMHRISGARRGLKKKKNETLAEYENALSQDLKKLDGNLKKNVGIATTAVVYPFGLYSAETAAVLKKLGYKASFTCREGINTVTRTSSLFDLRRYNRPYGKSSEQYFNKVLGNLHNS